MSSFFRLGSFLLLFLPFSIFEGFFAKVTTKDAKEPIWIIPDARRPTDVKYFLDNFPGKVITGTSPHLAMGICPRSPLSLLTMGVFVVRVEADEAVRGKRGYTFTAGVDDAARYFFLFQWSSEMKPPSTVSLASALSISGHHGLLRSPITVRPPYWRRTCKRSSLPSPPSCEPRRTCFITNALIRH